MKKQLRNIALAVVFAMAVSMIAPTAQVAEAATKKTFTYAEQETGDMVTTLVMDKGEKVDLKFKGVSNWTTYNYKWVSSNTKVAVVDSAGMVTAIGTGVATIKLTISGGDGTTEYTSTGVTVYVDLDQEVTIGTAAKDEIKSYTIEMGKTATLKANGLRDNVGDRYEFDWSSTDTDVATISDNGVITTKAPGLTVIQLTVKKVFSGEEMEATPIALLVTGEGSYVPEATATPAPTQKPGATATPIPTPTTAPSATPTATPTVTPVPSDEYVGYTTKLTSDTSLLLTFDEKVNYDVADIELYQLITAGTTIIPVKWEVADATLDSTGRQLTVIPAVAFNNGDKYLIKAGSADTVGTQFTVNIGAPNRVVVTYECLGTTGKAYAYDESAAIDVPVTLSYRLYYGDIDVTETYKDRGYMVYEFASNRYYDNVSISDNVLTFYAANVSTVVTATFTYYDESGNAKEVTTNVPVRSEKLPAYGIIGVIKSTVVGAADLGKIDWNKTTNQTVANSGNAKVVAMIADTYGNYFVTDERGVDEANKIYYAGDANQLFAKFGYGIEFSAADPSQIITAPDGSIYPYKEVASAVLVVTLTNNGLNGVSDYSKNIGVCQVRVLAESKLTSMTAEKTSVALAATALSGYESRFCETDVEILLKDQYGNPWEGTYNLQLSSTITEINNALDGSNLAPATLEGNVLHINAANIKAITNRTAISIQVTETTTNRKISVNVTLQNPTMSNGSITVSGWTLGLENTNIKIGEASTDEVVQYAAIEAYKTSSNNIKVGLYDDLHILETANHSFTTSNCAAGQVYILVKGPDGKVVKTADSSTSLGVYVDTTENCVKVNVAAPMTPGSIIQESLAAGKYTITATRIVNVGTTVQKVVQNASFTVEDKTKDVTFRSVKSVTTPLTVSGSNDLAGVKAIIESVLSFNLGGEEWTTMNANMITAVNYEVIQGSTVLIRDIEFAVPVDSTVLYGMSYIKKCSVNKAIKTGVTE